MIRKYLAGAFALVAATCALSPASAANLAVKDANSVTQALCEKTASDGSLIACHAIYDTTLTQIDPATKQYQISILSALGSPFQAGGQIGNTSFGAKLLDSTGAAFGTSGNPVYVTGGSGGGSTPTGPAGTPTASVVSVQGIAGMTPVTVSASALPLPTGAASQTTLASILTTLGTPAQAGGSVGISGTLPAFGVTPTFNIGTAPGIVLAAGAAQVGTVNTVIQGTATDIGATMVANTATTIAAINASRRGFSIQNQTAGNCYLSGTGTATADYHSLLIAAGSYYESKDSHVGTGALSVICASAGGLYGRQW